LSGTVGHIAGPNPKISYAGSGKTVYTNPENGKSVVYDNSGNYYRVQDAPGKYFDKSGSSLPNNVPVVGPNKTTQTGIPSGLKQALTHFKNTD
jgi:filamentous hemagglutinin